MYTKHVLYDAASCNKSDFYLVGEKGTLLESVNNGRTWRQIKPVTSDDYYRVQCADDLVVLTTLTNQLVTYEGNNRLISDHDQITDLLLLEKRILWIEDGTVRSKSL